MSAGKQFKYCMYIYIYSFVATTAAAGTAVALGSHKSVSQRLTSLAQSFRIRNQSVVTPKIGQASQ